MLQNWSGCRSSLAHWGKHIPLLYTLHCWLETDFQHTMVKCRTVSAGVKHTRHSLWPFCRVLNGTHLHWNAAWPRAVVMLPTAGSAHLRSNCVLCHCHVIKQTQEGCLTPWDLSKATFVLVNIWLHGWSSAWTNLSIIYLTDESNKCLFVFFVYSLQYLQNIHAECKLK